MLIGMRARFRDRASAHVVIIDMPAFMLGLDTPAAGERSYPRPMRGPGAKGKPGACVEFCKRVRSGRKGARDRQHKDKNEK